VARRVQIDIHRLSPLVASTTACGGAAHACIIKKQIFLIP
jgi:hypothetical protein